MAGALVDSFGRIHTYLRVAVTGRCNLRCRYCMPLEGPPRNSRDSLLTFEEIQRIVRLFANLGVTKVRLTGGEPTVRRGLVQLIEMLADISGIEALTMTTNGLTLSVMAARYRAAGLTGINVSLDSLRPERYEQITRRGRLSFVLEGIDAALDAGFSPLKVNTVVIAGFNDDELLDFVELAESRPIEVRFIEFMPFLGNGWNQNAFLAYREMRTRIEKKYELREIEPSPNAVAKTFSIASFVGSVGFITSMSENFCAGCNRLRITADGMLKPCLHSNLEVGLRDPMRAGATDEQLERLIRQCLLSKWREHPPAAHLMVLASRSMVMIGG